MEDVTHQKSQIDENFSSKHWMEMIKIKEKYKDQNLG
jgi:hypothetical protein